LIQLPEKSRLGELSDGFEPSDWILCVSAPLRDIFTQIPEEKVSGIV
jgi:hypothetical protein